MNAFENVPGKLDQDAQQVRRQRSQLGLDGLVGALQCVIINTEPERQRSAVAELLHYTGFSLSGVFRGPNYITAVLQYPGSADILVRSRRGPPEQNPFREMNDFPKSRRLPNTRLESFAMEVFDIERYVEIQRRQGVRFVTDEIVRTDTYAWIQTVPSPITGASYAFLQWLTSRRDYTFAEAEPVQWDIVVPERPYRRRIGRLDHVAMRVTAENRDPAILEYMRLTNYDFDFAIYVESLNSITNVTRHGEDAAMVFTSGISPYVDDATSGPTEQFVHNYGLRTHHMAFSATEICDTFQALKADGMKFLIELVGSEEEGLRQTFTQPSEDTMIVTEYIERYGGFTGFFTKSNVAALTQATARQ